jgi:phospholipase D1/2
VFISDWWLSPEMYLKRPASQFPKTQILEVLGELADRGVSVSVAVYKEVSLALTLNSMHTKMALVKRNPNIKVVRHPHRSAAGGEFLWSHHEKIICID